jgi:hypothetical protein
MAKTSNTAITHCMHWSLAIDDMTIQTPGTTTDFAGPFPFVVFKIPALDVLQSKCQFA